MSELFDSLPEAVFNAANKEHLPPCLENTHQIVLEHIQRWVDNEGEGPIYWPKGMAGIGKSTNALTVSIINKSLVDILSITNIEGKTPIEILKKEKLQMDHLLFFSFLFYFEAQVYAS